MSPRIAGWSLLGLTILFGLTPLVIGAEEISTTNHHLLHAALLAGAAIAGILCAGNVRASRQASIWWLVAALVSPVLVMFLMWPSEYGYFETHRYGHALEHLGIIGFGFLTGFGGQRYASGIGWAAAISIVAMALLSAWGYGVGPTMPAATVAATAASSGAAPDVPHGQVLFKQDCASCHGVAGGGGFGPSLRNEAQRKSLTAAEQWIEHPAPPMPALYPGTLSAQDVADVAAYVETLK